MTGHLEKKKEKTATKEKTNKAEAKVKRDKRLASLLYKPNEKSKEAATLPSTTEATTVSNPPTAAARTAEATDQTSVAPKKRGKKGKDKSTEPVFAHAKNKGRPTKRKQGGNKQ